LSTPENAVSSTTLKIVVIAGVRGSGRTLALRLLEDLGYTGIDNLPPTVLLHIVEDSLKNEHDKLLVVVAETRTSESVSELRKAIDKLRKKPVTVSVLFLDASESTLLDRLGLISGNLGNPETSSMKSELMENREYTMALRETADVVLDTSSVSPIDLKERLAVAIEGRSLAKTMTLEISSFGFKYAAFTGDFVFDVRFIPNPYYISELRPLTGKNPSCAEYVFSNPEAILFVEKTTELVKMLIPAYIAQGRSTLNIGIGCTGGRHRSVAVAEALGRSLKPYAGSVGVRHRELPQ
jgi:UPF0042 nucleotide-binding protein